MDFCSKEKRLIIEVDGGGHDFAGQRIKDINRDALLTKKGFRVLRIWANEIYDNLDGVMDKIAEIA